MWNVFDSLMLMNGFVFCWLVKDTIKAWIVGPEQTALNYRTGLNAILINARKGLGQ